MIVSELAATPGRRFPARRWTRNIAGGTSPIQTTHFAAGLVILDPPANARAASPAPASAPNAAAPATAATGGQVPWHNQAQEEVYFLLEGTCEMCLGSEKRTLTAGQAVYIPPGIFHQITNIGTTPARMIYIYGPSGDVAHWRQELDGTLPRAGQGATPPLPPDAVPQCIDPPHGDPA